MLNEVTIKTDLCVVGGGLAGVCTAISAARHGIDVVLMQERPVLGGNCSSEIRMWVSGALGKNNRETGIVEEFLLENLYRNPTKNHYIWDSILLDFVKREKNITLLMNTTCIEADTEQGSFPHGRTTKINSVTGYQMTTQKRIRIQSDYFADCSGDSILAPLTGAEFMLGREANTEFGELLISNGTRSITHQATCILNFGECYYVTNTFSTGEQHYHSIQTKGKSTVRRCAVFECVNQEFKFILYIFFA